MRDQLGDDGFGGDELKKARKIHDEQSRGAP
jgi:hypothetical protein